MAKHILYNESITVSVVAIVDIRDAVRQYPWTKNGRVVHLSVDGGLVVTIAGFTTKQRRHKIIHV